ncbi:hypothetical protein AMAG_17787 [Allomyces macrogynus ATCC 38327]|uniref:Uncharacterized protein n=1 Tax=Allomyces macrogynus (strain ATCC 38327) TaxID=578462 RepID=A0A0L0RZL0_ALLM3|nr:hypothetical protein AMAG_17787 [Allomyces macrogynus ATCC 38327]|eukprot:KNE55479.1 hypothetical protein AMAG_17787 [Allomyces macrogynus ATCC 38327]
MSGHNPSRRRNSYAALFPTPTDHDDDGDGGPPMPPRGRVVRSSKSRGASPAGPTSGARSRGSSPTGTANPLTAASWRSAGASNGGPATPPLLGAFARRRSSHHIWADATAAAGGTSPAPASHLLPPHLANLPRRASAAPALVTPVPSGAGAASRRPSVASSVGVADLAGVLEDAELELDDEALQAYLAMQLHRRC